MTDDDPYAALISEQFSHTIDILRAETQTLTKELNHIKEIADHRLTALEDCKKDHEDRLRKVQDSATQFKVLAGLATGGGFLSLIALIKSLTGIP